MLKDDGKLILLWDSPPETSEEIRHAVADALGVSRPFYFGGDSIEGPEKHIGEKVFSPLFDGGCFRLSRTIQSDKIISPSPQHYILLENTEPKHWKREG